MGWQIPAQIEQDIISGKAQYRTFQTGVGGQSILPVPSNAYAVIFGYDFSPAGGGFIQNFIQGVFQAYLKPDIIRWFETQQISFYTGADFYPFIHHVDTVTDSTFDNVTQTFYVNFSVNNKPISRQVYITSTNDITITHGLILDSDVASLNAIPQTNRTPSLLTYGGSGQNIATQTDFGPAATPIQFMQPSPKDYQAFGFGLLPNGASGQSFSTPDTVRGLRDASEFLNTVLGVTFRDAAACNYFLNLHYALYTESVPEQRG